MKLKKKIPFKVIEDSINLVPELDDEDKVYIAERCIEDFHIDRQSRLEWDEQTKCALEIAKQVLASKSTSGKANVKYPLITTAAIQYAARAYPEFIRNQKVVNCAVLGLDPDGSKEQRAKRVSDHMSWQLLIQSQDWEPSFDHLLHVLPIIGTVFKKTYFDPIEQHNCSELCLPDSLFVNQNIKSLSTARRVSHLVYLYKNQIIEQMRYGYFEENNDIFNDKSFSDFISPLSPPNQFQNQDEDAPRPILEQHRFLDLDGDGYEEPYIVTVDLNSKKLLRIYRRFEKDHVDDTGKNGQIRRIIPTQCFVDFHFIPSPDGSFMSYGFGQLLLPINETINSTINQLLDAGTFNNRPPIFLGREVRMKQKGNQDIVPGAIINTDCPAADLKNGVMPFPITPPSSVLFELLGSMIESGQQLSSITEVLQGQIPTQNSPATTVLAMVEQGLKPFSAIQKRVYRSLKVEYKQLYDLNALHLDEEAYFRLNEQPNIIGREDYRTNDFDIFPVADPSLSSDAQRLARAQALMQTLHLLPPQGQQYALQLWMDALQFPQAQIERLLPLPNPNDPPPPEVVKTMAEADLAHAKQQEVFLNAQQKQTELAIEQQLADVQMELAQAKHKEIELKAEELKHNTTLKVLEGQSKIEQHQDKIALEAKKIENDKEVKIKQINKPQPKKAS